jgi:transketolase
MRCFLLEETGSKIRTTIAYNNVPVKVVGAHAGISVGPDGATHQAIEDIAIMRMIPNMEVYVPCDAVEARAITEHIAETDKPAYLRLTREKTPLLLSDTYTWNHGKAYALYVFLSISTVEIFTQNVAIISCGPIIYEAIKAAIALEKEGIGVTVVNVPQVKTFRYCISSSSCKKCKSNCYRRRTPGVRWLRKCCCRIFK